MTTDHNEAMNQLPHKLATLIKCLPQAPFRDHLAGECIKQAERIAELVKMQDESSDVEASLRGQVAELEAEVQEQARCNGMGAERELALMAERDRLRVDAERTSNNRDMSALTTQELRDLWDAMSPTQQGAVTRAIAAAHDQGRDQGLREAAAKVRAILADCEARDVLTLRHHCDEPRHAQRLVTPNPRVNRRHEVTSA